MALCAECTKTVTAAVIVAPPDASDALSCSVGERIGLAMTRAAIAEMDKLVAETGAAPRGVNSLHFIHAMWSALHEVISQHSSAVELWTGLSEAAAKQADTADRHAVPVSSDTHAT